ncbi:hypothetical protein R6Q59_010000 [Mikania micrantha]
MATTQMLQNSPVMSSTHRPCQLSAHPTYSTDNTNIVASIDEARKHPLGVKPSGNALTSKTNLQMAMGSLAMLPDSIILLLFEFLDVPSLVNIGFTCRACFAYSTYDSLWRDLTINNLPSDFKWRGSWRASHRKLSTAELPQVDCSCLFADALYRPFQCSQVPLEPFVTRIPKANQIARMHDLSLDDFSQHWTDKPFILTQPVRRWKVFQEWDEITLLERYAGTTFRAEAIDWPLRTYIEYMNNNIDESPLYLFDKAFVEKMGLIVGAGGAYDPPECFREDLFTLLSKQRPDHRWLIVGPERSGSTFHKDPNATSAWNAVIRGSKYWIMFPNSIIPPGVYMSEDQSEVTSPLSIAEWLLIFHDEARNTPGCIEGICGEGEILHVPSGWWHLVVNLEPVTAITQNFVPRSHVRAAVHFLKHKSDQVSGFPDDVHDPYSLFMQKLEEARPEIFESLQATSDRKRKWEEVVGAKSEDVLQEKGFSFGFGDDIEDEVVE